MVVANVVTVVALAVAVADEDHSGHGHDLLRLSRDYGDVVLASCWLCDGRFCRLLDG